MLKFYSIHFYFVLIPHKFGYVTIDSVAVDYEITIIYYQSACPSVSQFGVFLSNRSLVFSDFLHEDR